MQYIRLGFVAILLLGMTYVLYQCGDTSALEPANPAKPATPETPKPAVVAPVLPAKPAQVAQPVVPAAKPNPAAPAPSKIPADDPQPQSDLNALFAQSIRLLEARDIVGIIKTLMPPQETQRIIQSGQASTPEEIAAMLRQTIPDIDKRISDMIQAMQQVQGQVPEMSADGNRAVYKVDPPIGDNKNLTFEKVDGNWYLH